MMSAYFTQDFHDRRRVVILRMVNIIFYSNPLYHSVVAVYQGVTTKDLYAQYGLSLDD